MGTSSAPLIALIGLRGGDVPLYDSLQLLIAPHLGFLAAFYQSAWYMALLIAALLALRALVRSRLV